MVTIGLFGTCGGSKWRDPFMSKYKETGIDYFNPQVDDWNEALAVEEARHLAEDPVILFPITDETYAAGSLSEVGFSIANAMRLDNRREFVIMIQQSLQESLDDKIRRKDSLRSRALTMQHLIMQRLSNVYVVDTLEEMLEVSLKLHASVVLREPLKRFNPHLRVK